MKSLGANPDYVGKILHINKGQRLSLQYHREKEETIRVLSGVLEVVHSRRKDGQLKSDILREGDVFHVAPMTVHRFCATQGTDVELLEVSTNYLEDVEIEDDYSRYLLMNLAFGETFDVFVSPMRIIDQTTSGRVSVNHDRNAPFHYTSQYARLAEAPNGTYGYHEIKNNYDDIRVYNRDTIELAYSSCDYFLSRRDAR